MKQYSSLTPEVAALLGRIKQARNGFSVTIQQIADEAKMPVGTVTHQLAGYNNLDIRVLLAVLRLFPNLSADWLLLGRGEFTHASARDILNKLDVIEEILNDIAKT